MTAYSRALGEFTTKDLRTLVANKAAREAMRRMPKPAAGAKALKAAMQEVGIEVGKKLGHSAKSKGSMAMNNYIDPAMFDVWRFMASVNSPVSSLLNCRLITVAR